MSFKANPYSLRIAYHQNWQNFHLSNLLKKGLSKNVLIEQFIRSVLYEKDIYVVDCQVVSNSLGNYSVFFTYLTFFKYRVHKLKPASNLNFKSKFNLFKESLKRVKKLKQNFFFYKRYARKLLKRKKKLQSYKNRLIFYTATALVLITKDRLKTKASLLVKRCWLLLFRKIKNSKKRFCVRTYKTGLKFFMRKFYKKFRWVRKQRKQRKNRNRLDKRIKQKRVFNLQKIIFETKMLSLFFSQEFEKLFNIHVKVTGRNIRKQILPAVKLLNKKAIQLFNYRFRTPFVIDLIQIFHLSIFFKKPEFVLRLVALNLKNKRRRQGAYLKQVFNIFLTCYLIFGSLRGLKFQVKGRINKALRTQTFVKTIGQMPTQSIGADISYSQIWVTDRVGSYSLQIWYYI